MLELHANGSKSASGQRGNLIVEITGERVPPDIATAQQRGQLTLGVLPAIPFEIVSR